MPLAEPGVRLSIRTGLSLDVYAYTGNDPINGEDPTGELCVPFVNSGDDFCSRSRVYAMVNADSRVSSRTNFFDAASIVTNALGGFPQSSFMHDLSADLEQKNLDRANQIRNGTLYATGSIKDNTAAFVHFEQSNVQTALDALSQRDPEAYNSTIASANSRLNGPSAGLAARVSDPIFSQAVRSTQKALGRDINFANQKDREALGNAVAKGAAAAHMTCTGSRVGACY